MDLSLDDEDVYDGTESITFTRRGAVSIGDDMIVAESGNLAVLVASALRRATRTQTTHGGTAAFSDDELTWHLPADNLVDGVGAAVTPEPGDRITDAGGGIWSVLEVGREALGKRWRCRCRRVS